MSFKLDSNKPQSIVSEHHKDHETQHKELLKTLNEILNECNYVITQKDVKIQRIILLFAWMSKNLYLCNKDHGQLLLVIKQKIREFDNDDMGKAISHKYRWMLDLQHPVGKYSSFGRKIVPVQRF